MVLSECQQVYHVHEAITARVAAGIIVAVGTADAAGQPVDAAGSLGPVALVADAWKEALSTIGVVLWRVPLACRVEAVAFEPPFLQASRHNGFRRSTASD
jgi:hypothetical protein